ncbi:MAG: hypothetical protein AB1428_01470 [Bacteroidota bacterium]
MAIVTEMHLPGGEPKGERFNYRGMHRYLVTLLTGRAGESLAERGKVLRILETLRTSCRDCQFETYAYCFLPDRLVLIVRGRSDESDLKKFLAEFRAGSSSAVAAESGPHLWTRKYQERVLRKTERSREVAAEVFRLPVKAGLAATPGAYEFQGSFVLPSIEVDTAKERTKRVERRER